MGSERLAIYGLGTQTGELLAEEGFAERVVCLLDGYEQSGEHYGKPVVPLAAVTDLGVDTILVAAKPASQRIILKRIEAFCRERHIAIIDATGADLMREDAPAFALPRTVSFQEAKRLIDEHDAISFDLFDTLLMRCVPTPADVFRLIEERIKKTPLARRLSFVDERVRAELLLSRSAPPDIGMIYEEIRQRCDLNDGEAETLAALEWETERKLAVPREDTCALLRYATEQGKKVCVVSDTYYSAGHLQELLALAGISGVEKVFASCDCGVGKRDGLFDRLLEELGTSRILHIGDDTEADICAARRAGFDTLYLPSAYSLFCASSMENRLPEPKSSAELIKLGMLLASLFNSPFVAQDGKIQVSNPKTVGAAFFAPLVTDLALWLRREAEESGADALLLCARDGYLLKQLLDELGERVPRCVYFLTSRLAALYSCLKTPQDVIDAAEAPFQGSFREMLTARFLMDEDCACKFNDIKGYAEQILRKADNRRRGYLQYLHMLELDDGKQLAMFDLISTGTTQMAMEKLTGRRLTGFYLMKTEDSNADKAVLCRRSMIDAASKLGERLAEDSFLLETILTSLEPSLLGFDESGAPEYQREYRTARELAFVDEAQEAIKAYFQRYLALVGAEDAEAPEWDVAAMKLIHAVELDSGVYRGMHWDDAYYHRTIPVGDLL